MSQAGSHSCATAANQAVSRAFLGACRRVQALMKERKTWLQMLIKAGDGGAVGRLMMTLGS
jgi:hypothetical protein